MGQLKQSLKQQTALSLVAQLTPMQGHFVRELVVSGVNPTEAARRAGFAVPREAGYRLSRLPHVMAAVRQERSRLFDGELANVAAETLRRVMTDDQAPAAARVSAARTVLEVTRELGRRQDDGSVDKQLHEMTPDELAGLISKWESERSRVAIDITPEVQALEHQASQAE
jgi:phage terminase small subunit